MYYQIHLYALETAEHSVAPAMITRCMEVRLLEST